MIALFLAFVVFAAVAESKLVNDWLCGAGVVGFPVALVRGDFAMAATAILLVAVCAWRMGREA